jgi:SOS response regulatory protein OraA/RecX
MAVRGRGRLRAERRLRAAGIAATVVKHAMGQASADVDEQALLNAALDRRLRGGERIADRKEFQRLYRHLIGQGFDADKVLAVLRRRWSDADSD